MAPKSYLYHGGGELPLTQCVILAGGLGTRLGALTRNKPKPLLPVAGRPFLDVLLRHAARFGFERILFLSGYRNECMADYVERDLPAGLALDVSVYSEPAPLGTAGALRHAADLLDPTFLLMNGDSVFDFNWLDLAVRHGLRENTLLSMALRTEADASRFGVVACQDGAVSAFRARGTAAGGLVNGGVYVAARRLIAHLPDHGSLETDVLPALADQGLVGGQTYDGFFIDIGVPDSYALASEAVSSHWRRPALFIAWDDAKSDSPVAGDVSFGFADMLRATKTANDQNWFVVAITNGHDPEMPAATAENLKRLRTAGAHIDAWYDLDHGPVAPPEAGQPAPGGDHSLRQLLHNRSADIAASIGFRLPGRRAEAARLVGLTQFASHVDDVVDIIGR